MIGFWEIAAIFLLVKVIVLASLWWRDHAKVTSLLADERLARAESESQYLAKERKFISALIDCLSKETAILVIIHYKFGGTVTEENKKKAAAVYDLVKMKIDMEYSTFFGHRNIKK